MTDTGVIDKNNSQNWTTCQREVMEKILDAKKRGITKFGLYGGGGVGKTFIASVIIEKLIGSTCQEALILAPTNSAVKSLKRSFTGSQNTCKISFKTIHSALGIIPDPEESGTLEFKNSKYTVNWNCAIVFVDEASMVNRDLTNKILEQAKRDKVFLIASGDRSQLFPVKEDFSLLMDSMEETFTLTTIIRQSYSNPISTVIKHCRDAVEQEVERFDPRNEFWESMLTDKGFGYRVYYEEGEGISQIVKDYAKTYSQNRFDYVKLGTFTNKKCKIHNDYIRKLLWGEFAKIEYIPGDLVQCKKPVIKTLTNSVSEDLRQNTVMTIGTECIVRSVEPIEREFKELILGDSAESKYNTIIYKGWRLSVQDNDPLDEKVGAPLIEIEVIDDTERARYLGNKDRLRQECKDYYQETNRNVWFRFYNHEDIFDQFTHAYCITIHTSQGKTYNTMGLDIADICNYAPNHEFRNRLIYTGASRAKENLIIIQTDNNEILILSNNFLSLGETLSFLLCLVY